MIRVLRVIARLNMGGPALHVAYLTRGLADRGYETTLVTGSLGRGEGSMDYVARELGVELNPVPELSREVSPLRDPIAIAQVAALIRRHRPHILHTHTAKAGAVGRLAAIAVGRARPPIVVHTFHGHVLRGYFDPVRTAVFRRLERQLARTTTRLVAVSPQVRDDLVALGVADRSKFSVIRLGIDLEQRVAAGDDGRAELRRLYGIPANRFVVGWVGRMTAIKRVEDVVRAFKLLRESGIEATLCLVGDGPDRVSIEQFAHDLGVVRDTLFVGYRRDVAPFYSLFDAFLLTSANEGTPVVAIESLAAERPVVATRVGGVPDVVEDGAEGYLVAPGDTAAMADALASLARDPELRAALGRAGRDHVVPRYRVARLVDDVDALYRELLSDRRLPPPRS
jgi:glycosyltransferase involved in cell wall biosynthesis